MFPEWEKDKNKEAESGEDLLGHRVEDRLVGFVTRIEEWTTSHTLRISSVPNNPYGLINRTSSITR